MLGVILLGSLFLTPEEFKNLGKQTIYGSAFGENIFLIRHSGGYWDTATEMKPLMHLWTLAVEELNSRTRANGVLSGANA